MTQLTDAQAVYNQADRLFNQAEVLAAIEQMATAIHQEMANQNPLVLTIMNGGLVLAGQLITQLNFPLEMSYLHATRYRNSTQGHDVTWHMKPVSSLKNRHLLLIDDIYDEGATLAAIVDDCQAQQAQSIRVAVLLNKVHDRKVRPDFQPDFIGLHCPDRYVFGYGMDYRGYWRNAAGIFAVAES